MTDEPKNHTPAMRAVEASSVLDVAKKRTKGRKINGTPYLVHEAEFHLEDFYAHLPTHSYLCVPTRELWPASSVNAKVPPVPVANGQKVKANAWLDAHRSIIQMTWAPGEPPLIMDRCAIDAGWNPHKGARVFNLYSPPQPMPGDATRAGPWLDHIAALYQDDYEHIVNWCAQVVQRPAVKINHALFLGGAPGIGKDSIIEPLRFAVGPHNFADITPRQMQGRFNSWVRNVIVRVSEVRDLGEVDRFGFYEQCKSLLASPPDVIRVDEKNLREHFVANVCAVLFTSNHLTDGLYLHADDRRHYIAWSNAQAADLPAAYHDELWRWYQTGGIEHVVAWLRTRDLSGFDPKAPPPKTPAFWAMVNANEAPESSEMRDVLDELGNPNAITLTDVVTAAMRLNKPALEAELTDRKNRRSIPHRMERAGYIHVRNGEATDGQFKIAGARANVYAKRALTERERLAAAKKRASTGAVL